MFILGIIIIIIVIAVIIIIKHLNTIDFDNIDLTIDDYDEI